MPLKVESFRKGIIISTVFNVINKGLVFLTSLIVAYYFGTQLKMDIYFYAYNTILILSAFMTSLNGTVLIPESMRLRVQIGEKESVQFLNFFFFLYGLVTLLICLVFLINPVEAFTAVSGFQKKELHDQVNILLLAIPLFFLIPLVNLLTDILTSYRYFSIPMIAGIVNGVFSILFLLIFHGMLDVLSLLTGLLLSYSLNLVLLVTLMKRRLSWRFNFKWLKLEKRIWQNIVFAQAGNITSSLSSYAPLYLLSGFNTGIITSLNFAQQISSLPTNLITNQFSAVAGIKFNELYTKRDFGEINKIFLATANFLIFILVPLSGIFFIFSSEIVSVLLERGAFGKTGVAFTSTFLQYLGFLLPMLVVNTLFARLFMASHKIIESFWYQIVFNVVLIFAMYIAIHKFGFIGFPVTLVAVHVLNIISCYFLEKYYFNIIQYNKVLEKLLLIVFINLIVGGLVHYGISNIGIHSNFLILVLGTCLYLGLILLIGLKFRLDKTLNMFINQFFGKWFNYGRFKN
jgi:putative peptidoglycan lipid II flippase